MSQGLIDLHSHTTHSDGSATPRELLAQAHAAGASAVAITDHDTVTGLKEGRLAAAEFDIELIDGIEISAEYSPGTMHVLGYFINTESVSLNAALVGLREARERRNPQIAERLQSLGVSIAYEEVERLAGNEVVGRPHFARLLVERGYAASIQDAFDQFLGKGAAAYVEKARLSPAASIALIHEAGGVAVLAHPYQLKLASLEEAEQLVVELAALGLDGVEAVYSRHSQAERDAYARMARRHGLLVTGGSDYHGTYKPDIAIVRGKGDLAVPYELLNELRQRATARRQAAKGN
ncbi:MAG: PHP domain-containing protein [Blastocatellia bacterium]